MTTTATPPRVAAATIHEDGASVVVRWAEGGTVSVYAYWLRILLTDEHRFEGIAEAWTDGANFHPQRLTCDDSVRLVDVSVVHGGAAVELVWADGTRDSIDAARLHVAVADGDLVRAVPIISWDASYAFPSWPWDDVMNGSPGVLRELLRSYFSVGVVVVTDVPPDHNAALTFGARMGGVASTHLGENFTVKAVDQPQHIGEVTAAIPLHIDLVYRQSTPEVQMLHALTQIDVGGENEFVDGRRVLELLDPSDVDLLRRTPVDFVAESATVHFRGRHPILDVDDRGGFQGVYYNQYKISFPHWITPAYFGAFERFRQLIHQAELLNTFLLPAGSLVMFNNRRVLHGRRSFEDQRRHVVGCFVRGDDVESLYRLLAKGEGA